MTGTLDADRYDAWFDTPWGRYAHDVELRAVLDAVGSLAGRTVVDVGCGTGRFTVEFERAGARVVGVDRDPGMLRISSSRSHTRSSP